MLLVESELLTEGKKENQTWFIEGVFAQAEVVNKNNRIYREEVLDREVKNFIAEYVNSKRAVGELSHPNSSQINPDRVAILIESLSKQGTDYFGRAKVLDTPCGKIVQAMLEGGVVLGVSTRGSGSVKTNKQGISEVCDDFRLHTIDAVMNPSAPKALVKAVYENEQLLDGLLHDALIYEEFVSFLKEKKRIKQIHNKVRREEAMVESVKRVLSQLINKT
jgi:hypothetical protein